MMTRSFCASLIPHRRRTAGWESYHDASATDSALIVRGAVKDGSTLSVIRAPEVLSLSIAFTIRCLQVRVRGRYRYMAFNFERMMALLAQDAKASQHECASKAIARWYRGAIVGLPGHTDILDPLDDA